MSHRLPLGGSKYLKLHDYFVSQRSGGVFVKCIIHIKTALTTVLILSRRCLEECPQLGVMDELQLLNLEHNLITEIHHLSRLQQLVVLNLYNNHISEMTGIEALSSLRILILGKNRFFFTSSQTRTCREFSINSLCNWHYYGSYLWFRTLADCSDARKKKIILPFILGPVAT